jgi:hypothetical protein
MSGASIRGQVWEPVFRHLTLALCALEDTGQSGDPRLRLETVARLLGSWVDALRNLAGGQPAHPLPGHVQ